MGLNGSREAEADDLESSQEETREGGAEGGITEEGLVLPVPTLPHHASVHQTHVW